MNEGEQPESMTARVEPRSSSEVATPSSLADRAATRPGFRAGLSPRPEQSVELHIQELVLDGFDPAHRYAIGEAVERELTRLLSETGSPIAATKDVEIAHLSGDAIDLNQSSDAEATGKQLAKVIYGGLGQ